MIPPTRNRSTARSLSLEATGASLNSPVRSRRFPLPDAPLVRAAGDSLAAEIERDPHPDRIDHVWISMDIGLPDRVLVSVNTLSNRNRDAGFDPRVRTGIVRGTWDFLPPRGAEVWSRLDYADIEAETNVFFEHRDRGEMEALLFDRCARARLLEVWGAPYRSRHHGIHQIHSRRASCAVPEDIAGKDGALKFYFDRDSATELLLFKFCGQP